MYEVVKCQVCHSRDAAYDSLLDIGTWGYVCAGCYKRHGVAPSIATMLPHHRAKLEAVRQKRRAARPRPGSL